MSEQQWYIQCAVPVTVNGAVAGILKNTNFVDFGPWMIMIESIILLP